MTSLLRGALALVLLLPAVAWTASAVQASAGQARPDSTVYSLQPASRLVVKTGKSGLFGFAGHSHIIRARAVSGELVYRPGGAASSLRLELPTDSLEVLTPPDTAEIRKVTQSMRDDVLQVEQYPTMKFAADSLDARSGRMTLRLRLTMHGVTRTVPVTADVALAPDALRATGTFVAKQTDFGIKPFSGGPGGTVKVADQVTFCFDLRAAPGPPGSAGAASPPPGDDPTAVPGCADKGGARSDSAKRVM
jgi:polyisoprenoid-binding protein YceI